MKSWMTTAVATLLGAALTLPASAQVQADPNFQDQIIEIQAHIDAQRDHLHAQREHALAQADQVRDKIEQIRTRRVAQTKKEMAAFLGVITVPVSPAMREQLKLAKGVGLTVEGVEADSPAAQAGMQQYDIIQKINDQWLINAHQLAVLVRMHKPGDDVTLSVIRQGQPINVTAKLVEKELAVLDGANLLGMPGVNVFGGEQFIAPEGSMILRGPMHLELDDVIKRAKGDSMTMSMSDDENTMTMTVREGRKHLTATDREGNVIFNGPIDTDEQRQALPEALKSKIDKLETKPGMIRMRMNATPKVKAKEPGQ
jgi:serine protease Do